MSLHIMPGPTTQALAWFFIVVFVIFFGREVLVDVEYNYPHYTNSQYVYGDLDGPLPGEHAIDFVVTDLDGNFVRLSDFTGKVVVLTTGSGTCLMYVSKVTAMNALAEKMSNVVFLLLYVREAHPGLQMPQHDSFEQKVEHAKLIRVVESEHRIMLVDDIEGSVHKAYGAWPNMAYIIDDQGIVQLRHKWVDPAAIELALNELEIGNSISGIGYKMVAGGSDITKRVMSRAGRGALKDFLLAAPGLPYHMFEEYYTK